MINHCPDCGVEPGELHDEWCDIERCPACGGQYISCGCGDEANSLPRVEWTGEWPGKMECREFGWYAKMTNNGWQPCDKDDEGAREDLNTLYVRAKWNKDLKRFVL